MRVRQDIVSLFIRTARGIYRPGGVAGFDHVYDMSDGGLSEGDDPRAYHVAGAPLLRIKVSDRDLYWHEENQL